MLLSTIICTHNPRADYLQRTLDALNAQTLSTEHWELLIIDNASNPRLAGTLDLSWHPAARVVVESELGILPARVRGLKEASAPLILFADDDNVLGPNYLQKAVEIGEKYPFLGCWGGSITPEFETAPPDWIHQYLPVLACCEVQEDRWSNMSITTPPTAGMCLRREVAENFIRTVETDPRRQLIGRRGKDGLTNGEDTDLALTACDMGLGMGQFKDLKLSHLMPPGRLSEDYLLRLTEGSYFCGHILDAFRGKTMRRVPDNMFKKFLGKIRRRLFWPKHERRFFEAKMRAYSRAIKVIEKWTGPE